MRIVQCGKGLSLSTSEEGRPMKREQRLMRTIWVLAAVWSAVVSTGMLPDRVAAAGVADLQVSHRHGQTFLTWKEPEELTGEEPISYEQFKQLTTVWSKRRHYRIYRSSEPIRGRNSNGATKDPIDWFSRGGFGPMSMGW